MSRLARCRVHPESVGKDWSSHNETIITLLADTGLIEYDRERGIVTTTAQTPAIEPYLDRVQNADELEELTTKKTGEENDRESS